MEKLTINWIKKTLKISGKNSKQLVIDRLENATFDELVDLNGSVLKEIANKSKNKNTYIEYLRLI
jgi:hypothetical protein